MKPRLFLDSDVVISSVLSGSGAAALLVQELGDLVYISNYSVKEMEAVRGRLGIEEEAMHKRIGEVKRVVCRLSLKKIGEKYGALVSDPHDAHVLAGSVAARASYLISYNLRHFKSGMIKAELGIQLMTPGQFLQYWRSVVKKN